MVSAPSGSTSSTSPRTRTAGGPSSGPRRVEVLRTHADEHGFARAEGRAEATSGQAEEEAATGHATAGLDDGREGVRRWRAQEAGHEAVGRLCVQLEGRPALLQPAAVQHGDPVAEGHGLHVVVRDVDRGRAQASLKPGDLPPRLQPQLGVEVRERLVEEEDGRRADDRASHRHALALPSGERLGSPREQPRKVQDPGRLLHSPLPLLPRRRRPRGSACPRCGRAPAPASRGGLRCSWPSLLGAGGAVGPRLDVLERLVDADLARHLAVEDDGGSEAAGAEAARGDERDLAVLGRLAGLDPVLLLERLEDLARALHVAGGAHAHDAGVLPGGFIEKKL